MNASTLCEAFTEDGISMQRLEAFLSGRLKRKETTALRFGRALHTRLLEPHLFEAEWQIAKPCSEFMKGGLRKGELCGAPGNKTNGKGLWLCGKHKAAGYATPPNYIHAKEAQNLETIRQRVLADQEGRHLHKLPGCEVSGVVDLLGVRCKFRLDKYGPGNPILPDIKKVAAGRLIRRQWLNTVEDKHYDIRAAMYVDAIKALAGDTCDFWWVACEDDEPFHVAIIRCPDHVLEIGRHKYKVALDAYKRARDSGVWPSPYPSLIQDWGLPFGVEKQYREMGII